jgi:hypothetical protein
MNDLRAGESGAEVTAVQTLRDCQQLTNRAKRLGLRQPSGAFSQCRRRDIFIEPSQPKISSPFSDERWQSPLNPHQHLFFPKHLQQMIEARTVGIAGGGEARRMDEHAHFHAEFGGGGF